MPSDAERTDPIAHELRTLHAEVDQRASELAARHAERLVCGRGCSDCCVDDITVFDVEADRIRQTYPDLLASAAPHPVGKCAFLDEAGACRVYDARPFVCRTQGLPLIWFEERDDGDLVEGRDICPLNAEGPPLQALPVSDLWPLGEVELRLGTIQRRKDGEETRVPLRSLFRDGGNP